MVVEAAAALGIFKWVWEQYGREFTDKTVGAAWDRIRWEDSAVSYVQKIRKLYGTMQILGQARPVSLDRIYTKVQLLDRPSAFRRFTIEEMEAEFKGQGGRYFHALHGHETRHDGLAMAAGEENLFILGKPGAGKTTFLKHVALQAAAGQLQRVPIFVGLKQLADSNLKLFDYVVEEFAVCDFPDAAPYVDRLLKSGKAIVLLDGLDEVNVTDDIQQRLTRDIQQFIRKYDRCRYLITCRLAASSYIFEGFAIVEMADFDRKQIETFVAKWFSGDEIQEARRPLFLAELAKAESEGLRELARVPLLLALLCLSFEGRLALAERRVELYEEALDALLRKWDASRNIRRDQVYRDLSPQRKQQMLAEVAAGSFDRGEYFFGRRALAAELEAFLRRMPKAPDEIDGEVVLQAIIAQHGLFAERAQDIYSFAHLTFQEYFTARYIVDNEARGTLPRLMEYVTEARWREVFLLTAGSLSNADQFFELFLQQLAKEVSEHPGIVALLRQVEHQAFTVGANGQKLAAIRSYYLSLDRTRALATTRALNVSRAMTRARAFSHALDSDNTRDSALARDRALALARTLAQALDINLDSSLYPQLALDATLVHVWLLAALGADLKKAKYREPVYESLQTLLKKSIVVSKDLGLAELSAALRRLPVQRYKRHERFVWQTFAGELEKVLVGQRGMPIIELTAEDWAFLESYLIANQLLLECLEQAVVTDREAIEERLLLV